MGHTGTLDPLATGLLLVAFGNYTKLIPYFEKDSKEYEFEFSLEGTTASLDAEEELVPAPSDIYKKQEKELTEDKIQEILEKHFSGEIEQVPPKYSALKIDGKRAVDRVRAGEKVEIKKRKIQVHSIELLRYSFPKISLRAHVSAGTYIRTIAGDFGDLLGTGAYVTKLRRTKIAHLDLNTSTGLDDFERNCNLDIKHLFPKEKFIDLPHGVVNRLNHGQKIINDFGVQTGEHFLESDGSITHVIEVDTHLLTTKRRIVV